MVSHVRNKAGVPKLASLLCHTPETIVETILSSLSSTWWILVHLTRPSRKAGFLRLAGLKKSSRIFSDVSLLPFDTLGRISKSCKGVRRKGDSPSWTWTVSYCDQIWTLLQQTHCWSWDEYTFIYYLKLFLGTHSEMDLTSDVNVKKTMGSIMVHYGMGCGSLVRIIWNRFSPGIKTVGIIWRESRTEREESIALHEVVALCKINDQRAPRG